MDKGSVSSRLEGRTGSGCKSTFGKLRSFERSCSWSCRRPCSACRCSIWSLVGWGRDRDRGRDSWDKRELILQMDISEPDLHDLHDLAGDAATRERAGDAEATRLPKARTRAMREKCSSTAAASRGGSKESRLSE